jgi:hypothetical protein
VRLSCDTSRDVQTFDVRASVVGLYKGLRTLLCRVKVKGVEQRGVRPRSDDYAVGIVVFVVGAYDETGVYLGAFDGFDIGVYELRSGALRLVASHVEQEARVDASREPEEVFEVCVSTEDGASVFEDRCVEACPRCEDCCGKARGSRADDGEVRFRF